MRGIIRNLVLAATVLISFSGQTALALDKLFGDDKMFDPGKSFQDENSKPLFTDWSASGPKMSISSAQKKIDPAEAKRLHKQLVEREDEMMRAQIQKVASWLQEFSLRNLNRFPGVYGDSNTIQRASQVQLVELVGPNPYVGANAGSIQDRELNGLPPGLSYNYNSDGTPIAGSPLANDEWTSELTAQDANRVQLAMDQSASPGELDSYRRDPPSNMDGMPGTIYGYGNGQGFLYVYGIGADGHPVRDINGQVYIVSSNTHDRVEDTGQEAGY